MTNLDSILKSRDITLPTKVQLVEAMVFPVVMYGCESWTVKKPECRRTDAFKLWCWRKLLRVPWTPRRSNQSILKEISPRCSLEGLMLNRSSNTLATWCEELTHWKRLWCWERLKAGEGRQRMRWLDGITTSMDMSLSNSRRYRSTGKSGHDAIHGVTKSQTGLSNQTTPHPLCQDILVNGCLEQGVGIEPYSVHSTHWPGMVVPAGIVPPSQGKEQVWTTGFLHLFQCFPCFALGTCLMWRFLFCFINVWFSVVLLGRFT